MKIIPVFGCNRENIKYKCGIRIRQKNNYCHLWVKETRASPRDPDEQTEIEAIEEEEDTPGPMYWYYLTVKILLWVVLQVKRRRIRAHVLVLSYNQDSTLGSTVLQVKSRIRAHVLILSYGQDSTLGSTPR